MLDLTGYKLTFDDEFDTRSISQNGVGTTWSDIRPQWRYDAESDIGFGHSSFLDAGSGYDPFSVSGGALSITAEPNPTKYGYPGSWASGLISTQGSFSQTYGYFEMRAEVSSAPGSWDAFWMLPETPAANPTNASGWQELDIAEHYGDNPNGVYSTIHTTDDTPASALQVYSETPGLTAGYHTYGMAWGPDTISFYVDGKLVGSQATPSDMHGPMYLLADLATQSDASGSSMTTKIDYIRAFSDDPSATAVVQQAVSAPDGQDPGLYGATSAAPTASDPTAAPAGSTPVSAPTAAPVTTAPTTTPASTPTDTAPAATSTAAVVSDATAGTATAGPTPVPTPAAAPVTTDPTTTTSTDPTPAATSTAAVASDATAGAAAAPAATDPAADVQVTVNGIGRRVVDLLSSGQTLQSAASDTFLNHGQGDDTFVFDPGFGLDIVRQFKLGGDDHDTLSLPSSDFTGIADVLRNAQNVMGAVSITDPVSGDTVRLSGVTKGQLVHARGDITFHA